jgi:uncharacterized protein (DUF1697 family)
MNESTSVCFLRGINVTDKNVIKMADLTKLFSELGFKDISTYLQSGNVVFSHNEGLKDTDLKSLIYSAIQKKIGLDIPVIFRNKSDIDIILKNNVFLNNENADIVKLYVTMLETDPEISRIENLKMKDFTPERFEILGREIFLFCPNGYGRAKLNNNFLEKKLGSKATTRNWKTITAIAGLMNRK